MNQLTFVKLKLSIGILIIFTFATGIEAQNNIQALSYNQLDSLANNSKEKSDFISMKSFANRLLEISKAENDTLKIAKAYLYFLSSENRNEALVYVDSLIDITTSLINDYYYPAYGLIQKGDLLFKHGKIHESLQSYISARDYSIKRGNIGQITVIIQRMAKLKTMLGSHQEALDLHKEYLDIAYRKVDKSEITRRSILAGLYNLTYAYLELNQIDSAQISLNHAKLKALEYNIDNGIVNHFPSLKAEIDYYSGEYEKALLFFDADRSKAKGLHLIANLYFSGKISASKKNDELAITYFEAMDSVILDRDFPFQNAKDGLLELAVLYKKRNMSLKELSTINRYLQVDSAQISFVSKGRPLINNKFDKPYILNQRKILINELNQSNNYLYIFGALFCLVLLFVFFLIRSRILLKKRISKIRSIGYSLSEKYVSNSKVINQKDNSELSNRIRIALNNFEETKGFLDKELTLSLLAQKLDTNSTYLSRFVNNEMGINFSTYLNGLRIQFAIQEMNRNSDLKKYNLNGLAHKFGYQNSNTFSRAFIKLIGIKPSIYIRELNKSQ